MSAPRTRITAKEAEIILFALNSVRKQSNHNDEDYLHLEDKLNGWLDNLEKGKVDVSKED